MSWDIAPECISTVFLCIIWVYSRKGHLIPNLKNRLFQVSLLTTFCAMTTNIASTILISWLMPQTVILTWVITLVYFIATPLMGFVYFFYTAANLYEGIPKLGRYFFVASIPGMAYLVFVLINPFTKFLFNITVNEGYVQGPFIAATYIIFYLYCIGCVVLVVIRRKKVEPTISAILFSFPLIAGIVITIQLVQPKLILSGSVATGSLLIIYLYLQNKQISMDYLTHLPNRQALLKMIELYLRKQVPFSIVVLSLREFKGVNDTHGQQSGDYLLAAISNYLRKELGLREGTIYRYSGDEFSLLLRDGNEAMLKNVLGRILDRMNLAWDVPGCACILSMAVGIASYPKTSTEIEGIINGLEYAVSSAKKDRENYYVCYCTPELLKASTRRHMIFHELEENLQEDTFEIHYQPIFSVVSEKFIKAEALLRMTSKNLEKVFPDEFIPVAEETGLIIDITYVVLEKVCCFIRRLMDQGIEIDNINVNFSALQFTQKDLIPRMLEIMEKYKVPGSKIKVEMTESILAENTEAVTASLIEMNELGIRIGLDDFGTGYSNLISVLDLPLDLVKLDKSLVWSAVKNERCSIAVQNFSRAFHELGMAVLAEGVETEEQRQFVVKAGCTLIQGYFYAKPMPEESFLCFLKEHQAKKGR